MLASLPQTPTRSRISREDDSGPSPPPSPRDPDRFLRYASKNLGVPDANTYLSPMRRKRYGPDILAHVDLSDLVAMDVGIQPGDAIRLQHPAPAWHKERVKRRREDDGEQELEGVRRPFV